VVLARHERPGSSPPTPRADTPQLSGASSSASSGRLLGRDLLSDGVRISVELAPLRVPDRATVVAAVRHLIGLGPAARAGRTLDGSRWAYDPAALDAQAERMVRRLPPALTGDAGLPRLRDAADPDLPLTVFLGEDRASLCIDHRLGDGFLGVQMTAAALAGRGAPAVFTRAVDENPFRAAAVTTFLRHPSRGAQLLRDRFTERRASYDGPSVSGQRRSLDLVMRRMDPETFRSLAAWSRGRVPPTVATMFALHAALRGSGIPVMDEGAILVDLRRYLPSGRSTLANFVVGHPVTVADGIDAAGARFSRDLHVGRPLAALAAGLATRSWRRRGAPASVPAAASPIVSDMGFLRALEPLPWASDDALIRVSVDPATRNGITALTAVLRRHMNVSVSFDSSLYDRESIAAAVQLLCRDPEGLLP
jgi:hypothetical protein